MLREEWRLHAGLFGGRRFALFPGWVAVVVSGATALLVSTGTDPGTVVLGLHALALVFGLHTGSVGLVGRDAARNLLGDVTLLVFSARTLPLSRRRLLAAFVVKDVVYYAGLFLVPAAVGAAIGTAVGGVPDALPPARTGFLWLTLVATFVLGLGTTLAALGLGGRGWTGRGLLLGSVAALGLSWAAGLDPTAYTPYGAFLAPTPVRTATATAVVTAVVAVGWATVDPAARSRTRTTEPAFRRWLGRVGDPLAVKTLLSLHRSAGGLGKVGFSAAVLLGVTVALLDVVERITGVEPSVGVTAGAVLGLSAFTTYNWLAGMDDIDGDLVHPLAVSHVLRAKFRAFLLLGPAVGLGCYTVAVGWLGTPVPEALVGGVLAVGVSVYVFGLTVALAGLAPNEFLFDTPRFAAFGVGVAVPLVPVLVVGVALAPVSSGLLAALGGLGTALAGVGVVLFYRSLPRWDRHHRLG